jgi:DNA-binding transcriptional MerR regulator
MALTIGQVATAAEVNIQTIRYDERRGMFAASRRTASGYRQYAQDAVSRLRFIKHAQELGFSLKEIQELLGPRVRHGAACDAVQRRTREKIADPRSPAHEAPAGTPGRGLLRSAAHGRMSDSGILRGPWRRRRPLRLSSRLRVVSPPPWHRRSAASGHSWRSPSA